jgi:predicted nuclease with RNAse H fold
VRHLVGLDIGWSRRRRSNGIAVLRDDDLVVERLSVDDRNEALRTLENVDVVAIDAPLLPSNADEALPRECERIFSRGDFQRRCKPGMSHVRGTGQTLRAHGGSAAQLARTGAGTIVEAFPNAFLGVVLPEEVFANVSMGRGKKFDWLYDRWIEHRLFAVATAAARLPELVAYRCEAEKDHDYSCSAHLPPHCGFRRSG